jgi:hypothetical protein
MNDGQPPRLPFMAITMANGHTRPVAVFRNGNVAALYTERNRRIWAKQQARGVAAFPATEAVAATDTETTIYRREP